VTTAEKKLCREVVQVARLFVEKYGNVPFVCREMKSVNIRYQKNKYGTHYGQNNVLEGV
jgi:hypothetical protein